MDQWLEFDVIVLKFNIAGKEEDEGFDGPLFEFVNFLLNLMAFSFGLFQGFGDIGVVLIYKLDNSFAITVDLLLAFLDDFLFPIQILLDLIASKLVGIIKSK